MHAALETGREAVALQRWRAGYELLGSARAAHPSEMEPADLELLATAALLRGRTNDAVDAMTAAHEIHLARGDTAAAAQSAGWMALEMLEIGDLPLSGQWMARGLRLLAQLEEHKDVLGGRLALVPAALTGLFVGDFDEAMRKFVEISAIAEKADDRELAAHATFGYGKCLTTIGRTAEGLANFDRAVEAVQRGDVSPLWTCVFFRVMLDVAHESFDLERAREWTAVFDEWCARQPDLIAYSGQCAAYRAKLHLLDGRWEQAAAAAASAAQRLNDGDFTSGYVAHHELAELHRLRGEYRAAEEHYRRAATTGWEPQPGWALLRLAQGDPSAARTMLRRSSAGADEGTRRRLLPACVEVELAAGDIEAARAAARDLEALSAESLRPMLRALAATASARVALAEGRQGVALDRADEACSTWASVGAPYEAARCRVLRGRMLQADGQNGPAAAELDTAHRVFSDLGARPAVAEIDQLLGRRATGSLTEREVEVLRLVSTGLTNRGIADRLTLSEKTVARHLSNIFAKLGLSTRAAATAYAYENGLV